MKLIAPTCTCCSPATTLLPREDLGLALAVCPRTGRLHQAEGQTYVPTELPARAAARPTPGPVVQIDLSRDSYA